MNKYGNNYIRHNVFVANVAENRNEQNIHDSFACYGKIIDVALKPPRHPNDGTKIAYIKFESDADADRCVKESAGHMWDGLPSVVKRININELKNSASGWSKRNNFNEISNSKRDSHLMVICVEDPCTFWAQNQLDSEAIAEIDSKLKELQIRSMVKLTEKPVLNEIYTTIYAEDNTLYRCSVMEYISDTKTEVRYIDYGNSEVINNNKIFLLPKNLSSFRPMAKCYRINNLVPIPIKDAVAQDLYKTGFEYLKKMTCNSLVYCRIYPRSAAATSSYIPIDITLPKSDINLRTEIVNRGFAVQQLKSLPHGGGGDCGSGFNSPTSSTDRRSNLNRPEKNVGVFNPDNVKKSPGKSRNQRKVQESNNPARQNLDSSLQKLTKNQEQLMNPFKVHDQKTNFETSMSKVLGLMESTRQQRRQFASESDITDCIEATAQLSEQDMDKINCEEISTFSVLAQSLDDYNQCQEKICNCTSKVGLQILIKYRDDSRIVLYTRLEAFLNEVQTLPLEDRLQALEAAKKTLSTVYGVYLTDPLSKDESEDLKTLMTRYKEWKDLNKQVLSKVRQKSDDCHTKCGQMFGQLHKAMSWTCSIETNAHSQIVQCLESLAMALEGEIESCSLQTSKGSVIIASTIQKLNWCLNDEISTIYRLINYKIQYENLRDCLHPWLQQRPDMTKLVENYKKIKTIKSKLRHKLADLQDLEEELEVDENAVQQLKADLVVIRANLHAEFEIEDANTAEYINLQVQHFPELPLLHPNVDLDVASMGLVKEARDLECYDLTPYTPSREHKQGAHGAFFVANILGTIYVLQEYEFTDDTAKTDFTSRVLSFARVKSDNVVPIVAILAPKGKKKVYIQTPHYKYNLIERVSAGNLTNEVKCNIIISIAKGLQALDEKKIIHGSLHWYNVFVDDNDNASIAPFDFSTTLAQRIERASPLLNGLCHVAPESREQFVTSGSTSPNVDIYSLGCLVLYLFWPKVHFITNTSGTPDITIVQASAATRFARKLIARNPKSRPTIREILDDPFLQELVNFVVPPVCSPCLSPEDLTSNSEGKSGGSTKEKAPVTFELTDDERVKVSAFMAAMRQLPESDDDESVVSQIDENVNGVACSRES